MQLEPRLLRTTLHPVRRASVLPRDRNSCSTDEETTKTCSGLPNAVRPVRTCYVVSVERVLLSRDVWPRFFFLQHQVLLFTVLCRARSGGAQRCPPLLSVPTFGLSRTCVCLLPARVVGIGSTAGEFPPAPPPPMPRTSLGMLGCDASHGIYTYIRPGCMYTQPSLPAAVLVPFSLAAVPDQLPTSQLGRWGETRPEERDSRTRPLASESVGKEELKPAIRPWQAWAGHPLRATAQEEKRSKTDSVREGCASRRAAYVRVSTLNVCKSKSRDVWQRGQHVPRYSIWMCVHHPNPPVGPTRQDRESAYLYLSKLRYSHIPMNKSVCGSLDTDTHTRRTGFSCLRVISSSLFSLVCMLLAADRCAT